MLDCPVGKKLHTKLPHLPVCRPILFLLLAHFSPYATWMNLILDVDVIQPSGLLFSWNMFRKCKKIMYFCAERKQNMFIALYRVDENASSAHNRWFLILPCFLQIHLNPILYYKALVWSLRTSQLHQVGCQQKPVTYINEKVFAIIGHSGLTSVVLFASLRWR